MTSADFTIYTPSIGTLFYTVSSPLGRIQGIFCSSCHSQFLQFSFHHYWVDRGGMVWEFLPNTSTHELTSVIFGSRLIYHVLWGEPIVFARGFVVHECPLGGATVDAHISAAFIGCLFNHLWRCIVSTWKQMRGSCVIGKSFMHWTTTPSPQKISTKKHLKCIWKSSTYWPHFLSWPTFFVVYPLYPDHSP